MFDTLPDILADSLRRLEDGAANPGSPWRNPALGTVGLDGAPQVRTVVLRGFDPAARVLEVHTDTRSAKNAELRARPVASLHGWEAGARVQLRMCGAASLHEADDVARAAWLALRPKSRATYCVRPGSGKALSMPDGVEQTDEAAGFGVFCVVRLHFQSLDWLLLGDDASRRARFAWSGGRETAMWIAP